MVKEIIIADILGHKPIVSKHGADACDKENEHILFEYLSCLEGKQGQLDRMYNDERKERSLHRISRNNKVYFAVFYKNAQLKVKRIYEIETDAFLKEAGEKLDRSKCNHIGFSEKWARENGKLVYQNPEE